jgi:hypothetical protein
MKVVEQTVPGCANSLFLQGACADLNPVRGDTRDFKDVERYGLMLGGEIIKMVGMMSAPDYAESEARIAVNSETILLPARPLPPREPAQKAFDEAGRKLAMAKTEEERKRFAREQRQAEEALIQIERGDAPVPAEVQVIHLGDVALVGLPGEPFTELGLEIKARSVIPHTFVVGYANDYLGYLATLKAWQQGGYEVGYGPWSRVGPQGGPLLVEKAVVMIARLGQ